MAESDKDAYIKCCLEIISAATLAAKYPAGDNSREILLAHLKLHQLIEMEKAKAQKEAA